MFWIEAEDFTQSNFARHGAPGVGVMETALASQGRLIVAFQSPGQFLEYAFREDRDGFWEYHLKPWDVSAGVIIMREAGAEVTDHDGSPWTPSADGICCANPALHPEMLEVIARGVASVG